MDNKKAIDLLNMIEFENAECNLGTWYHGIDGDMKEALEMAIKALEQEPCDDAISRSEAIRIASGYCHWTNIPEELAKLPSVSTEKTAIDCSDSICRADAIKLVKSYIHEIITESGVDKNSHTNKILTDIVESLAFELPPVTQTSKNVNDVLDAIKADLQTLADDEWNQQVMASKGLKFAIEIIENYQMAMMEGVEE